MVALALFAVVFASTTFAATPDVAGKWKWKYERSNGESMDIVMDLKQDDSKLAGTVKGSDQEMKIQDGKIGPDRKLSFYIVAELNNGPLKIQFEGKAEGDKIRGQASFENDQGEKQEREWTATREKRDLSGKWTSIFKRSDGTPMESNLQLKQTGDKLSGTQSFNENESEIREGKVQGNEVSFSTVRERDGRTVTTKYRGKIQANNTIKGEIESDWTGEVRKIEWEAKKAN